MLGNIFNGLELNPPHTQCSGLAFRHPLDRSRTIHADNAMGANDVVAARTKVRIKVYFGLIQCELLSCATF